MIGIQTNHTTFTENKYAYTDICKVKSNILQLGLDNRCYRLYWLPLDNRTEFKLLTNAVTNEMRKD